MAKAKRKAVRTMLFESVHPEVPHVMDLLREVASVKSEDTAIWASRWEVVRSNTALASIEKFTRELLIASGLTENPFLDYANIQDLYHLLDYRTLTQTQRARVELLITSLGVKLPEDLDRAHLEKLERQLYAAAAIELQEYRDRILDGSRKGVEAAAAVNAKRDAATVETVKAIEAKWTNGAPSANQIFRTLSGELGDKAPSAGHISRIRRKKK